ncbi:MAG: pyridoxal-phosphate dependent enzyme [Gemmatimonadetes bacterium]|nr:pyridoxal-phosphate dependent enzyme [Gemmatimonadota bacterium]
MTQVAPAAPALFRRFPQLVERIPWLPLGTFPTPLEPLRLGAGGTELWVKRDDLSGEAYGGNKVRKLEFLLADARRRGAERLITAGAAGSHHCLAVAVYGSRLGFRVTLVLFPQRPTPRVRQALLLDHACGAELRFTPRMETVPLALLAARLIHRRERVYVIAPGGSDSIGTLGYVSGALELAGQIQGGSMPPPQVVHLAAGTLGTAAGVALGLGLAGLDARVIATRVAARMVANERALARLVARTGRVLRWAGIPVPSRAATLSRIQLRHDQFGEGYARETAAGRKAAELFEHAGLALDPTYTAKAAAGLLAAMRGEAPARRLFWHTLSAVDPAGTASARDAGALPEPFRSLVDG